MSIDKYLTKLHSIVRKEYAHETPYIPMSKDFARTFINMLENMFPGYVIQGNKGMYCEVSAFITKPGEDPKCLYLHTSDFRYWNWEQDILIRRCKDTKDYTGFANHKTTIERLKSDVEFLLAR